MYHLKENKKSFNFTQLVRFVRTEACKANDPLFRIDGLKADTLYQRYNSMSKEHIPTIEDITKWPHLEGIVLPEVGAEIDLPKIGETLPEEHHSRFL